MAQAAFRLSFHNRGMGTALFLLAFAGASWAGPVVHPIVKLVQARPSLQLAVSQDLMSRSNMPSWTPRTHSLEVQKVSLALAASRDQIPKEVMTALIGPQAAEVVAKMSMNQEALQAVLDDVGADDPAAFQRLEARLDEVFDNDFGGGMAAVEVHGKEGASRILLGKSPSVHSDFKRSDRNGPVEAGSWQGKSALRVELPDGRVILAVQNGKAKSWTEAREKAKALGPGFDLPVRDEYMPVKDAKVFKHRVSMGKDAENTLYPMWLRTPDELSNGPMRLTPILWGADDFNPGGLAPYNISQDQLAGDLATLESQLARLSALDSDERDRLIFMKETLTNLRDATKDGWPVYAVHVEPAKTRKEVPPPSLN